MLPDPDANPDCAPNRYYAYGVRNSFGLAFDPVTGALWDTENGPDAMDEVNHVPAGFNRGWLPLMGPDGRSGASVNDLWEAPGSAYSDPEFAWAVPVAPTVRSTPGLPGRGVVAVDFRPGSQPADTVRPKTIVKSLIRRPASGRGSSPDAAPK